jgi:hypothetical protein
VAVAVAALVLAWAARGVVDRRARQVALASAPA